MGWEEVGTRELGYRRVLNKKKTHVEAVEPNLKLEEEKQVLQKTQNCTFFRRLRVVWTESAGTTAMTLVGMNGQMSRASRGALASWLDSKAAASCDRR